MASASKYPAVQAVKSLHKTGEWAKYFKEGDAAMIENDYIQVSLFSISVFVDAIAAVNAAATILNSAADEIWRQDLRDKLRSAPRNKLKKRKNSKRAARLSSLVTSDSHRPSADSVKVEEELAKGKRSVRKQIVKARAFVDKFSSDLEIRRTAADTLPELLTLWEELKHAYQAENNTGEKVQDCLDKHAASFLCSAVLTLRRYPKTSEMIRQTKESMDAKANFPALFERLVVVTKLDNERKELHKSADNAKATRLGFEKRIKGMGATLDPSYIPAPSYMPATPSRAPDCY